MSFKSSVLIASFCLALVTAFAPRAEASLAERINQTALDAFNGNLQISGGKVILYGVQTNGSDTNKGRWACAKVVSIVLRKAGVRIPIVLGVASVESALRGWQRIEDERDVQPGDVVVWTHRWKGNPDGRCTGSGTCHVGIATTAGYFHNSPARFKPVLGGMALRALYTFKVAFRPPN